MCGIILILSKDSSSDLLKITFQNEIFRRGPDSVETEIYNSEENINLLFAASILWLQGTNITKQPVSNNKSIFVYNGDIFQGIPDEYRYIHGDTKYIFNLLNDTESACIHDALFKLHGPYAFIYYDKFNKKVYFGRDKFGRRSMLIGKNQNTLILSSVAKRNTNFEFIELPSAGTFIWDLKTDQIELYPFSQTNDFKLRVDELEGFLKQNIRIIKTVIQPDLYFINPDYNQTYIFELIQNVSIDESFGILLKNNEWMIKVSKLHALLNDSIKRRISGQPKFCKMCIKEVLDCSHCTVGVLFSGGVDCSILAFLCNQFVDEHRPIDLFNVAFDENNGYKTPDRVTGLETLQELKILCPNREWRFKEINISKVELDEKRDSHIADLIYPLKSILDDSLGCALWFAARGLDDSHCRVLLVGMGADELFGGYTKHRAAFKKAAWLGLHGILNEDWQNLPYRNLARDDRVVSDHGKQLRTPYLDENIVNFVRNLQCWEKTYPSDKVTHGFGDKILLRSLAYHLGLKKAAFLKKRALQFGSRIANKKEVAHEVSPRLS